MAYVGWPSAAALRRHKKQQPPKHHDHGATRSRRKTWYHHAHEFDKDSGLVKGFKLAEPRKFICSECPAGSSI